ncbi:MAG: hypothetical protein UGF89_05085 [Acutalibacteraceae bacterium]|nr:hypothetical protein [Acutalibacteraceae bacterium]
MADYSYQDLMKMQNDAIRRAEDMQRRARQSAGLEREKGENLQNQTAKKEEPRRVPMPNDYLENLKNYGSNSSKNESEPREEGENKSQQKQERKSNNQPKFQNSFEDKMKSVFGDLNIDSDKALLLSLILLLSEEKADELLIMALIYMLT